MPRRPSREPEAPGRVRDGYNVALSRAPLEKVGRLARYLGVEPKRRDGEDDECYRLRCVMAIQSFEHECAKVGL